jgi:hypothetical protein
MKFLLVIGSSKTITVTITITAVIAQTFTYFNSTSSSVPKLSLSSTVCHRQCPNFHFLQQYAIFSAQTFTFFNSMSSSVPKLSLSTVYHLQCPNFHFLQWYLTVSTIKCVTDPAFLGRIHVCLMFHSPCLCILLRLQAAVRAKSLMARVMTHLLTSEIIIF